jgi:thiamine-phosphate diphosphorylase
MLREKDLEGQALWEQALPLARACRAAGRLFLVNDRIDVALGIAGAGAHVGKAGIPVADARRLLGEGRCLGYSAHGIGEARVALAAGADYVTLSPIFPSRSKPDLVARGVEFLREALRTLPADRVIALGGIETAGRVAEVAATGVAGAAVMGRVMRAEDPGVVCREMVKGWESGAA